MKLPRPGTRRRALYDMLMRRRPVAPMAPATARVHLEEPQFRQLCAGRVVRAVTPGGDVIELSLAGIGLVRMLKAVCDGVPGTIPKKAKRDA